MVVHKLIKSRGDWRFKKLEELSDSFNIDDAIRVGLSVGDLQVLRHRGCIDHIRVYQDTGYWTKYKFCIPKELRDKSKK